MQKCAHKYPQKAKSGGQAGAGGWDGISRECRTFRDQYRRWIIVGKGGSSRKVSINSPKKAKMRGRETGRGRAQNGIVRALGATQTYSVWHTVMRASDGSKKASKNCPKKWKWGAGGQAGAGAWNEIVWGLGTTITYSMWYILKDDSHSSKKSIHK